jgi:hypothetical protein
MNYGVCKAARMVAVKATFNGNTIVLPEEARGLAPGRVIVIFEDALDGEEGALWLKAQEAAFAKAWDNPEDGVFGRM